MLVSLDHKNKKARLILRAQELLTILNEQEHRET